MASIEDVAVYLCRHYPLKHELSKARLTKMVYLADWRSCIERDRQVTSIKWYFNHYGPYVRDVEETAMTSPHLRVTKDWNYYGDEKWLVSDSGDGYDPRTLSRADRQVLEHVIEQTKRLNWGDFIHLVYSTYPIVCHERYSKLDLRSLAKRYRIERKRISESS